MGIGNPSRVVGGKQSFQKLAVLDVTFFDAAALFGGALDYQPAVIAYIVYGFLDGGEIDLAAAQQVAVAWVAGG